MGAAAAPPWPHTPSSPGAVIGPVLPLAPAPCSRLCVPTSPSANTLLPPSCSFPPAYHHFPISCPECCSKDQRRSPWRTGELRSSLSGCRSSTSSPTWKTVCTSWVQGWGQDWGPPVGEVRSAHAASTACPRWSTAGAASLSQIQLISERLLGHIQPVSPWHRLMRHPGRLCQQASNCSEPEKCVAGECSTGQPFRAWGRCPGSCGQLQPVPGPPTGCSSRPGASLT